MLLFWLRWPKRFYARIIYLPSYILIWFNRFVPLLPFGFKISSWIPKIPNRHAARMSVFDLTKGYFVKRDLLY